MSTRKQKFGSEQDPAEGEDHSQSDLEFQVKNEVKLCFFGFFLIQ